MAKREKIAKGQVNSLGIDPRELTVEQRRELFAKRKAEYAEDWRTIKPGSGLDLVPFNILALDVVLRWGGLKRGGHIYSVHGDEGSSKSTLGYTVLREYQKGTGEPVVLFDYEGTTTSAYLRAIGVDEDQAHVETPLTIEEGIKKTVDFIGQGVRFFIFDSIPRMQPDVKDEDIKSGKAFKSSVGRHARAMADFYRILLPKIRKVDGAFWMVNQTRSRIEASQEAEAAAKGYDTITNLNYTMPGGRDHRFAVGNMAELKAVKAFRPDSLKEEDVWLFDDTAKRGEQYIVTRGRIRSLKNKATGNGFREGSIWTRPGYGLDENISIRELARALGFITSKGKRWAIGRTFDEAVHVFDDKAAALKALVVDENPELLAATKKLVVDAVNADSSLFQFQVSDEEQRYLAGEQSYEGDEPITNNKIELAEDEL